MTKAERLRHHCPECNARPGAPCVDRLGDELKRGHVTRGPGALEAHKAKEAERINARAVASFGPLFAHLAAEEVRPVTAAELIDRDRRAAARSFDLADGPRGVALLRQCNKGLEWLHVHHLARELERLTGDLGRVFAACAVGTYPLDYLHDHFRRLMTTTEPKEIGPHRVPAPGPLGFRIEYRHHWRPAAPLMTAEEFDARFRRPNHWTGAADQPEPPSAADLFDQAAELLRRNQELPR